MRKTQVIYLDIEALRDRCRRIGAVISPTPKQQVVLSEQRQLLDNLEIDCGRSN